MKRFLTILAVLVVLGGGLFAFGRFRQQSQRAATLANLQTTTAERGPLVATVGATGVVRSNQSAVLSWATSGTVDGVQVQKGDVGQRGDLRLARLGAGAHATIDELDLRWNGVLRVSEAGLGGGQRGLRGVECCLRGFACFHQLEESGLGFVIEAGALCELTLGGVGAADAGG